ncbi:PhzF family phenazine biosynthesis protein [Escherichia coli]
MFSPAIGIVEDPVTGDANEPIGCWFILATYCPTMARCCVLKAIRGAHWGVTA